MTNNQCYSLSSLPGPYNYQNPPVAAGYVPGSFADPAMHPFGCTQCPPFGTGSDASVGSPAEQVGYRWGVAINHWLNHDKQEN